MHILYPLPYNMYKKNKVYLIIKDNKNSLQSIKLMGIDRVYKRETNGPKVRNKEQKKDRIGKTRRKKNHRILLSLTI